jgi:hypothetical protein
VVGDASEVSMVGRKPEDAPAWTEVDRIGLFAVRCPVAKEEEGRSSLRSEGGGVLLSLARGGKHSGSCSGGWRHVGAVHVDDIRQWGAEERRRWQSEGVRDGDGVGDLRRLCFSPKTMAGDKDGGNRRTWRSGMACAWRP